MVVPSTGTPEENRPAGATSTRSSSLSLATSKPKAKLVLAILDHVKKTGLPVSNSESPLFEVTRNLAALKGRSSTQVSLKAREVLIPGQMPSYEEHLMQMEAVLKASLGIIASQASVKISEHEALFS